MINLATLEKTSDNFAYQRMLFKKRDFAFILNREKISTKLNDFLTRAYYQRQRLIAEGFIGLAYTYRINLSMGNNKNHRTFALFAPNKNLMVDEAFFLRVIDRIGKLSDKKAPTYQEKKFLNYYQLVDAKPHHYKIDESLTEGKRVYLQYIELIPHLNPSFNLGLNYVIYAPLVSIEILYLPEKYIQA